MNAHQVAEAGSHGNEIIVAVIGLVGGVVVAVLSNWDKLFHNMVTAKVSDYTPSGDFETEVRHFVELSGVRAQTVQMVEQVLASQENALLAQYPDEGEDVRTAFRIAREQSAKWDDFISVLIPIWRKYYEVSDVEELNRFYSTKPMRSFVAKSPHIANDYMPIMMDVVARSQQRVSDMIAFTLEKKNKQLPSP